MISIVVIVYNMHREAKRTLFSLDAEYQTGVSSKDYEVIVIDNGSPEPLDRDFVTGLGPNFRYHYHDTTSVSPAKAVNVGVGLARGDEVAVIVDGARIATPGLVNATRRALRLFDQPFVCALSWHLGHDIQNVLIENGYDTEQEDSLLDSVDWPDDGYRLFEISTIAPSSRQGFLNGMPSECSWFAMCKAQFLEAGGFDERFQSPGGGLVNHDFLKRIQASGTFSQIVLLGEGVFHQMHGGVSTNVALSEQPLASFQDEYTRIHGAEYKPAKGQTVSYFGSITPSAFRFVAKPDMGKIYE